MTKILARTTAPRGDRYAFDFGFCRGSAGWCQFDTTEDASYFGMWINPITLQVCGFLEGDIVVSLHDSAESFRREVVEMIGFYHDDRRPPRIDPPAGDKRREALDALSGMGLAAYLHRSRCDV